MLDILRTKSGIYRAWLTHVYRLHPDSRIQKVDVTFTEQRTVVTITFVYPVHGYREHRINFDERQGMPRQKLEDLLMYLDHYE